MRIMPAFFGLLIAFASMPALRGEEPPPSLPGGLERVPNAKVALAYAKPGVDWTKYHTIELKPLVIPTKVRNAAPKGTVPEFGESYVLRDKDVAALQSAYDESTRKVLSRNGYTFVDTPQADTLIVAPQVIDIKLSAPIEGSRAGYDEGPSVTFSQGGGSIEVGAVFADGSTGQVIAEAADRAYPASVWGINNSVSNMAQARQAFDDWADKLAARLKSGPEK
jgi:hypothetical protein